MEDPLLQKVSIEFSRDSVNQDSQREVAQIRRRQRLFANLVLVR